MEECMYDKRKHKYDKCKYEKGKSAYLQSSGIKPRNQKITVEVVEGDAITLGAKSQIDAQENVGISGDGQTIKIRKDGIYFLLAAPQTGFTGSGKARFWLRLNGDDVANSNVQLNGDANIKDVIVIQAILELESGDRVQVIGDGSNAQVEAIQNHGEPLVPSIIFSLFKIN